MAKTRKQVNNAPVLSRAVDSLAMEYMKSYATAVLEDRSIPSLEDGLKPVQRRILWSMYDLGLKDTGSYMKSARVIGHTMGRLHPHGDAAIYAAMVRLASGISDPLISGYGNWGGHAFDAAAPRYTECRFSDIGYKTLFDPFYLRAIETIPNYDGSTKEPVVLPAVYPLVLAIGQSGIAVGTTTSVPSFTFESLKKVTIKLLKEGTGNKPALATAKVLAKYLVFSSPYGGKVTSPMEDIIALMKTGTGPITWTCDYTVDAKRGVITMTGFPPEWSFENRTKRIAELPFVAEAIDQSDKDGIKFVVRLKKMSEIERTAHIKKICDMMSNTITYRVNVNRRTLNNKVEPNEITTVFSAKSIVDLFNEWLTWRLSHLETRALQAEETVLQDRLAKQELRLIAINGLDIIFKILRTKGIDKVAELSKKLKVSLEQSKEIWAIAVGQLDKLSLEDTQKHIKSIKESIKQVKLDLKQLPKSALRHMELK